MANESAFLTSTRHAEDTYSWSILWSIAKNYLQERINGSPYLQCTLNLFCSNLIYFVLSSLIRLGHNLRWETSFFQQIANTALEVFYLGFGPLFCHLEKWFPDELFLLMPWSEGVHGRSYKNVSSNCPDWLRHSDGEEHNLYTTNCLLLMLGGHHKPTFWMVTINQCGLQSKIFPTALSKTSENKRWGNYIQEHQQPKNSLR